MFLQQHILAPFHAVIEVGKKSAPSVGLEIVALHLHADRR